MRFVIVDKTWFHSALLIQLNSSPFFKTSSFSYSLVRYEFVIINCAIDHSQLTLLALFNVTAFCDTDILLELHIYPLGSLVPCTSDWGPFLVSVPFVWSMGLLGPMVFPCCIMGPFSSYLGALLALHIMLSQLNADDFQGYRHGIHHRSLIVQAISPVMRTWMSSNRLCLNCLKPQFIRLDTCQHLAEWISLPLLPPFLALSSAL